ncbi:MAG: hypothetical protein MG2_1189 [uncultured Candidatus Poseidoniales archaeon]|nr:MAG: hypothetical protein MG2_1189 [uncultured Candidatus Poseidoniales archaeon]
MNATHDQTYAVSSKQVLPNWYANIGDRTDKWQHLPIEYRSKKPT